MDTASPEFWSLVGSGISIVLGLLAIVLTLLFFILGKNTESRVCESLTKIETQASMLERITGKQLDRLTKFVTQPQVSPSEKALTELIPFLKDLPTNLIKAPNADQMQNVEALNQELAIAYGALYFYVAQTNFWSQLNLPAAEHYDPDVPIQNEAKSVVDLSAQDFTAVADILVRIKPEERLSGTAVEPLFQRTKEFWRTLVRSSADVFVERGKQNQG